MIFSTAAETNIANDNHRRHSGASKSAVADLDKHICRTRVNPSSGTRNLAPQISNFRIGPLPRTVRNDEK
jgi:hypothetical protein